MATITALFFDKKQAERAFDAALRLGYDAGDITVVMSKETRERAFPTQANPASTQLETQAIANKDEPSGEKLGGPVGGTIGTLAPAVAAVGAALIPGIGLVAGPLATALAAAGAVGIASGLLGVLANWGVPEARLKEYATGLQAGGILLGVKARSADDAQSVQRQWRECGGRHIAS